MMEITDFTKNGKCSGCGNCCSDLLPITDEELEVIRKYVKKHKIKSQVPKVVNGVYLICPFRSTKGCVIYEVRPQICRSFVCNKPIPTLEESKKLAFTRTNGRTVSLKWEIFNDPQDLGYLMLVEKTFKELFENG